MVSPYDDRTEETRSRIYGNREGFVPNKYYQSAEGNFYFYINTKGYYHIVKPCKINYDGHFSHYEIKDCLLTKDGTLKEVSCRGVYETRDVAVEAIKNFR